MIASMRTDAIPIEEANLCLALHPIITIGGGYNPDTWRVDVIHWNMAILEDEVAEITEEEMISITSLDEVP